MRIPGKYHGENDATRTCLPELGYLINFIIFQGVDYTILGN